MSDPTDRRWHEGGAIKGPAPTAHPEPEERLSVILSLQLHADALQRENERLRASLVEATRDGERLDKLAAQIETGDLGDVTLARSDSPPMETVNIYLGESAIPCGLGTNLREAIDGIGYLDASHCHRHATRGA